MMMIIRIIRISLAISYIVIATLDGTIRTSATAFTSTSIRHNDSKKSWNPISKVRLFLQEQSLLQRTRGDRYGSMNNSTILSAQDAASIVGVQPPESNASIRKWKVAYMIQKYITPILHLFDPYKPPNSSLNVYCMWWKALSGNDPSSPVYDHQLSYDLLPSGTRRIILYFKKLFPRLHHANVEIRTAFLDQAITKSIDDVKNQQHGNNNIKFRLITFGAGYDVRSIKLKERGIIDEAIELDLPIVIDAKERIYTSNRFRNRRPQTIQQHLPKQYYRVDLNNITHVHHILNEIVSTNNNTNLTNNNVIWYNIFVFEAVMIYLNEGIPHSLLQICSETLKKNNVNNNIGGALCFADRLENVPGGDYDLATNELSSTGWTLIEWLPKPGLARHMGRAIIS